MPPLQPLPFTLVNAFAPTPHAGNPAAVVLFPAHDERALNDEYLLSLARDFNLSETVFLSPIHPDDDIPQYAIRWFTPSTEVPLCGHGTAAAASVLFTLHPDAWIVHLQTRKRGQLTAARAAPTTPATEPNGARVTLELPLLPASVVGAERAAQVTAAVTAHAGVAPADIVRIATFGDDSVIVQVQPGVDVGALAVDAGKFYPEFPHHVILTQLLPSTTHGEVRATCRVFAPGHGVDEDPVTGAVWAVLTAYYLSPSGAGAADAAATIPAHSLLASCRLDGTQLSARGGQLTCTLEEGGMRAKVTGRVWRTGSGTLEVFGDEEAVRASPPDTSEASSVFEVEYVKDM